jgi:hypothetical protein
MQGLDKILTKDFLISQYSTKSIGVISKEVGCSKQAVSKYLINFNIPRRTFGGKQEGAGCKKGNIPWNKNSSQVYTKEQLKERNRKKYFKYKEKIIKDAAIYKKNHPWIKHYSSAKYRCNSPKCSSYKFYGGRGIKFLMTVEDFKFLWFRDLAWLLKRPSIDRKDPDGNYELGNCQFIELADNKKKQRFHNQFSASKVTDCSRQI